MFVSTRLSAKLNDTLGVDAAGDLVNWLEEMRAEHRELREGIRSDFAEFRNQMRDEMRAMEARLVDRIHAVDTKVDQRYADLMKWSFVFWVGAVAAVALLAGVLGR